VTALLNKAVVSPFNKFSKNVREHTVFDDKPEVSLNTLPDGRDTEMQAS